MTDSPISPWRVFIKFLLLGCYSFGGPAAHIGYFRKAFVEQEKWLNEASFARLIALCQFLPGPGSTQLCFAVGLKQAGLWGGTLAFLGFVSPSFFLVYFAAVSNISQHPRYLGVVDGLKLLAVVVVADAVYKMFRSFCKHPLHITLALVTTGFLLAMPSLWSQVGVLIGAGLIGYGYPPPASTKPASKQKPPAPSSNLNSFQWLRWPLILFAALLILLPISEIALPNGSGVGLKIFSSFYHAGSLVFGGGHVVLPLLQQVLSSDIDPDRFMMGYALAQAVPGPMFTLSSFLGADLLPQQPLLGAFLASLGIFLPGLLLVFGLQRTWDTLSTQPRLAGVTAALNATVVGILLCAFINPVFSTAVKSPLHLIIAVTGLVLVRYFKLPIWALVLSFATIGGLLPQLG